MAVDPANGALRSIGFHTVAGLEGRTVAGEKADPWGRFLYADVQASGGSTTLFVFPLGSDGKPRPGVAAGVSGVKAEDLAFASTGTAAYAPASDGRVNAYRVASDGRLEQVAGSPFGSARSGRSTVHPHPSSTLLFVGSPRSPVGGQSSPVGIFLVDAATGVLKPVARSAAPQEDGTLALGGATRVWLGRNDGSIHPHAVDATTGTLAAIAAPVRLLVDPDNPFLGSLTAWVADATGNYLVAASTYGFTVFNLRAYAFDHARGTLRPLGSAVTGFWNELTADPTGPYLRSGDMVLRVDAARGLEAVALSGGARALVPGTPAPLPSTTTYALDQQARKLRVLRADAGGVLQSVNGGTSTLPGTPVALEVGDSGKYVAVLSSHGAGAGTLSIFQRSAATGLLTAAGNAATGAVPTGLATTRVGANALVAVTHAGGVDTFRVGANGAGVQKAGGPFVTGYGRIPVSMADGRWSVTGPAPAEPGWLASDIAASGGSLFLAVNKETEGAISTLWIRDDGSTGAANTGLESCAVGLPPDGSTFSATGPMTTALATAAGRLVYAVSTGAGTISAYSALPPGCHRGMPWMVKAEGSPYPAGAQPVAVAADPLARFVFTANAGGTGSISAFRVDPSFGALKPVSGSPFPLQRLPAKLWTDALGRFLYVADAAGNVTVHAIDQGTGRPGAGRAALASGRTHQARDVIDLMP